MGITVSQLWARYREAHPDAPEEVPISFHFCDNPADAATCLELVLRGEKRATASSMAELERDGLPVPRVGDYAIVTGWKGEAHAVIRTTQVDIARFGDVPEEFARAEGEGDLTLDWWRSAHRAYYERVLTGSGVNVDDDLEIVLERFETVMIA